MVTFEYIVRWLMALFMVGSSIAFVYKFFIFYKKGKLSENWKAVTGTILESRSEEYMNGDAPDIRYIIKYHYEINGNKFIGDRLFFKTYDMDDLDYTRRYPKGKQVNVYYNPDDHKDTVLEKGARPEIQLLIVFALILLGIAYGVSPL